MTKSPIPEAALQQHIFIGGKTGYGKSNAAKVIAEDLMRRGERVCAIDPTGTWWGLRLQRDGKKPSDLSPMIFGGQRGDLAGMTGYSTGSGGYGNLLGSLRSLGLIDYPARGLVAAEEWLLA